MLAQSTVDHHERARVQCQPSSPPLSHGDSSLQRSTETGSMSISSAKSTRKSRLVGSLSPRWPTMLMMMRWWWSRMQCHLRLLIYARKINNCRDFARYTSRDSSPPFKSLVMSWRRIPSRDTFFGHKVSGPTSDESDLYVRAILYARAEIDRTFKLEPALRASR